MLVLCWLTHMYRSFAKIHPPFLHRTSRNDRGWAFIHAVLFDNRPTVRVNQPRLETCTTTVRMKNPYRSRSPPGITTIICWCFFDEEAAGYIHVVCKITGHCHRSEIHEIGLVFPCIYTFERKQTHIHLVFANKL